MNLFKSVSLSLGAALLVATASFSGCATGGKTAGRSVANVSALATFAETVAARTGASAATVEAAAQSYISTTFLAGAAFSSLSAADQTKYVNSMLANLKAGDSKLAAALGLTGLKKAEFVTLAAEIAAKGESVGSTGATGYGKGEVDPDVAAAVNKISDKSLRQRYRLAANNIQALANDPEIFPILKEVVIEGAGFSAEAQQALLGELNCVADRRLAGKAELVNGREIIKKVRQAIRGTGVSIQQVAQAWDQASVEVIGRSTRKNLRTPCDFIDEKVALAP
ncbi:MAG: hypothetical protein JNL01_01215 [Bdellovibrionales bacterium]|nr:hypothetical protein [Bdellovibrionales bacterium]